MVSSTMEVMTDLTRPRPVVLASVLRRGRCHERREQRRVAAISGCHWTPTQNRSPGASIASRVAVGRPAPPPRSRGASRTDWWWWQCARRAARPTSARPRRVPRHGRTSTSPNTSPPGLCSSWPTRSGTCWSSDAAGVHRHHLHAAADPEHGQAARLGRVEQRQLPGVPVVAPARRRARAAPAPYRAGSTSAPPVITSPSSRATTDARPTLGRPEAGGSSTGTPPAARSRRRTRRAAGRRAGARRPTPPARGRSSARSSGRGASQLRGA